FLYSTNLFISQIDCLETFPTAIFVTSTLSSPCILASFAVSLPWLLALPRSWPAPKLSRSTILMSVALLLLLTLLGFLPRKRMPKRLIISSL
ncbi:hypothetical protein F4779DRAFT_309435, partial [Xylariaceae sp. FL0662B]